nr:YqzL family protein [Oceanobacillus luteolus]
MVNLEIETFSNHNRKAGFLVLDITWKVFSQTGNIETYLLLKELENVKSENHDQGNEFDLSNMSDVETVQKLF